MPSNGVDHDESGKERREYEYDERGRTDVRIPSRKKKDRKQNRGDVFYGLDYDPEEELEKELFRSGAEGRYEKKKKKKKDMRLDIESLFKNRLTRSNLPPELDGVSKKTFLGWGMDGFADITGDRRRKRRRVGRKREREQGDDDDEDGNLVQASLDVNEIPLAAFIGLFVGSSLTLRVPCLRRSSSCQKPTL